jgi:hypothetical protein
LLLIGLQGLIDFFPLAGGLSKFYANAGETTNTAPTTLSAIQAASQTTFLTHNYTPLVISRNDKIKQLTNIMPT